MPGIISLAELLSLLIHVKRWISNLKRAKIKRKRESIYAIRAVIQALRETTVYLHFIRDGKQRSVDKEQDLSRLWSSLGYSLDDLGLNDLSLRCKMKGRYWANPQHYDDNLLNGSLIKISSIERIAQVMLKEIK